MIRIIYKLVSNGVFFSAKKIVTLLQGALKNC